MTLPFGASKAVFNGNGQATRFPFSFRVWETSQLNVVLSRPDGTSVEAVGWTAELTEDGGTVSYLHEGGALPVGWRLAVLRDMPFVQGVNLVNGTMFHPEVIEIQMDQATAERQQLKESVDRSIKVPPTSQDPPELLAELIFEARDKAESAANTAANCRDAACECAADAESIHDELFHLSVSGHLSPSNNVAVEYTPQTGMLHVYVPQGPQGETGPVGAQGERGPQGIQGARGEEGLAGIGWQGPEGRQGVQGPKGDVGATGERGPQGTPGPKGQTGDKGPMGDAPWSSAFGHFRIENGTLLLDCVGAEDAQTFFINPATGELEVVV